MRLSRRFSAFAALLALPLVPASAAAGDPPPAAPHRPVTHAAEVRRIQVRQDSVLRELRARDVSALTPAQRAARGRIIERFAAYVARGEFPRNYDFPDRAETYFVDRKTGAVCAVGHLLVETGHAALVERIAATDNNVKVAALADEPELVAWLDEHGLTLAEAARIQIPYVPSFEEPAPAREGSLVAARSANLAGFLVGSSGAIYSITANARGTSGRGAVLGLAAGALATGVGAASLGSRDVPRAVAVSNLAVGIASSWLSARAFNAHRRLLAARRAAPTPAAPANVEAGADGGNAATDAATSAATEGPRFSLAPVLPTEGRTGTGLSFSLRF